MSGVPDAGDIFVAMKDEKQAKEIATLRQIKQRELELAKHARMSLEQLYEKIQKGEVKDLNVIVKADVQGSVEAVAESLRKLSTDAIRLNVIHCRWCHYRDRRQPGHRIQCHYYRLRHPS